MRARRRLVVVGAGHAGFTMAALLRSSGWDGSLTLVSSDPDLPYQRPPLSKAALTEGIDDVEVSFRGPQFYDDHDIRLLSGTTVGSIHRASREVELT